MPEKVFEIHMNEAMEINEEISVQFANKNSDYAAIQKAIEEKHGEVALMLAFRCMVTRKNTYKQMLLKNGIEHV